MDKKSALQVIIVSGRPGVGKTTFENFCQDILGEPFCQKRSTVDKVKEIAREGGWKGGKELRDREFLSDLKDLFTDYNDMPLNDALRVLKNYTDSGNILDYFTIKDLKPELIKRYLRFIFVKNPMSEWGVSLIDSEMIDGRCSKYFANLIDEYGAYYWVNYESRYDRRSILINLLNNFSMELDWNLTTEQENIRKKEYLDKLMGYMQRDLTPWEKKFIDEDYYYDGD